MSRIERILNALGLTVVLLHLAGAFLPASWSWGFHHFAFLPRAFLAFAVFPLLLLVPAVNRPLIRAAAPVARALETRRGARALGILFVMSMTIIFIVARTLTFLLSDSQLLIRSVSLGFASFTADTLAAMVQLWFHAILRDVLNVRSDTTSFRVLSTASGVVWLAAMCFTTARLTRNGWQRFLLLGLLATAGLTKLFYGYPETGPLLTAAIGLYIWAAVRVLQDGKGMIFATAAFLAAAALHVTGLLLFPSFLFLLVRWASAGADPAAPDPRRHRGRLVRAAVCLFLPVGFYVGFWIARGGTVSGVIHAYRPYFDEFIPIVGPLRSRQAYTLFSTARLFDFLNEQIFIAPLGILALAAIAATRAKTGPVTDSRRLLLLILVPFLLLSLVFNRKLGGARDWDLLATLAVPAILLTALALFEGGTGAGLRNGPDTGRRLRPTLPATALFLVAVSAAHLAGIILVDVDRKASVRHFEAIFDDRAAVSTFARSYALEEVGHYYVDQGEAETASGWFRKAALVDPTNSKAIGTLGSYYASEGRHAEAIPLLREAVRLSPQSAMSHYNLGSELSETAHWDEAAVSFTEAIRLDPRLLEAYLGLSLAENRSGRLDKADSVARAGLLLFPGDIRNSALFLARGTALERRGKPRDAEAAYGDALALDPDNREALFNLGRLLAAREAYGEAIPRLERLGSLEPGDAEAAVNLGVAYLHSGRPGDAEDAFGRAIGADPGLFEAYANLALIHENAGDDEQAAAVLEQYVSRNPGAAPEILFMIRQLRARAGGTRP